MSDFHAFALAVNQQYERMAKAELFTTAPANDDDDIFAVYLAAFPPGTNSIFRTNTEHDCSCCKNFVRRLGGLVGLGDGMYRTVWDIPTLGNHYDQVAEAMRKYVRGRRIDGIFRTKEAQYGAEFTREGEHRWHHFWGKVRKHHQSNEPDAERGKYAAKLQVFSRGLVELKPEALDQIIELIQAKTLYRGEEHLAAVQSFRTLQKTYQRLKKPYDAEAFALLNATKPAAQLRNTVIGTLAQDLSADVPLETAVAAFEKKVAPENYKRPTALVTPRMVQDAMKKIVDLGLEPALERRMAAMSDITVNNVLWVDKSAKAKMAPSLTDTLMAAAKTNVKAKSGPGGVPMGIEDFMTQVAPKAKHMELMVHGKHASNFVVLTAPVHADAPRLFKWDNGFAWSYAGNLADSEMRKAAQARGGRVDGVFRFTHSWNHEGRRNASLMDLHVFLPANKTGGVTTENYGNFERVGWNHRKHPQSGGAQDVDYIGAAPAGYIPVENITFPDLARLPEGTYRCAIHNWSHRLPTQGGFKAEIECGGQLFEYDYPQPLKHHEWVPVADVTLKNGVFTVHHKIEPGAKSRRVWGVHTEHPTRVAAVIQSPNYWDGQAVGNRHWFFVLEGCKTDEEARGIYNEFLRNDLEQHRKVFELVGAKTKCKPTDDQLAGVGFSSTRNDEVDIFVTEQSGTRRLYTVKF